VSTLGALILVSVASFSYPSYPLRQPEPDLFAPGDPFKLVDLRYSLSDTFSTDHAFAARVRVKDWGYLGASFQHEERTLTLQTQRWEVDAQGDEGAFALRGAYRAPRVLVSTGATRVTARGARGWVVRPSLAVRVTRDLELLASLDGDSRPSQFVRAASVGFLWQRGAHLEAFGEYAHLRESTAARADNTIDSGLLAAVAQLGPAEVSGGVRLDDVDGRFPRREMETDAGLRFSLAPRLLLEGGARTRFETGAAQRSHHYDGALTFFARRFTLPRAGRSAEHSLALARRATELGYNERRLFDDDSRRAQRERLSLARQRDELRDEIVAEYEAQVDERAVPTLGFELVDERDRVAGTESRIARVVLGVPWPPAWPWRSNDAAVAFLRLDLERERGLSGPGYRTIADIVRLTAFLNREMELRLSWGRESSSPLDLIRGIGERRTVTLDYVYAFGR
jgi:hypothetical protein